MYSRNSLSRCSGVRFAFTAPDDRRNVAKSPLATCGSPAPCGFIFFSISSATLQRVHRKETRVVLAGEFTDRVVVGERLGEQKWQEMIWGILCHLCEVVDRLPDLPHQRGNLSRRQLLRSRRVVEEQLLDLDAEALKHDAPGQARS